MSATYGDLTIDWLGYATARIADGERTVYVDPGRYGVLDDYTAQDGVPANEASGNSSPLGDGDLVLVTHDDHYDPDGIERVATDEATVAVFEGIRSDEIDRDLRPVADLDYEVRRVAIGDSFEIDGIGIEAITAYNESGGPHTQEDGTPYHPKGEGIGYRLSFDGTTVFYPGDSDVVPEYEGLSADVFLAPIDDAFTMSPNAAAEFAEHLGAELVVPVHYDTFEALEADEEAFAEEVRSRGLDIEVLSPTAAIE